MSALTLNIEEEKIKNLKATALRVGITPEDLVKASLEDFLSRPSDDFKESLQYLLDKNKELYERLS